MNNNGQQQSTPLLLNQSQTAQWAAFQKFNQSQTQPQPLMLQHHVSSPLPLMFISPQIQHQQPTPMPLLQLNQLPPVKPINDNLNNNNNSNISNENSNKNESESKLIDNDFNIQRYDICENIENMVENYFGESIKNLKSKPKKSEDNLNILNIEIQTTDYNHGLSASTTTTIKMGPLLSKNSDKKDNLTQSQSNQQQKQQLPPSLLSLKVSPVDMSNSTTKSTNQVQVNKNSSNLFPILNEIKSESSSQDTKTHLSNQNKNLTIPIEHILHKPGRDRRPHRIIIILRGPPGSGKSFLANLIKQEEEKYVSPTDKPKLLSIDNYFINEQENEGNKTQMLMKYEYDESMDEAYQRSLIKSFKKLIDDDLFNFIIVDMINEKINKIEEMSTYARQRGFYIYVAELLNLDANTCFDRNVHNRTLNDIKEIIDRWEHLPENFIKLDVSIFMNTQEEIEQVEMDDNNTIYDSAVKSVEKHDNESQVVKRSKWESNENGKKIKGN